MKTYSLWVLCVFVLWKTCRNHGSSQCKKIGRYGVQFRSSVFSSRSKKKQSLTKTFTSRLILCAARCLEDDNCVGIKEEKNDGKCSKLAKNSDVGYIWIRNSGTSKAETCKRVNKKAYLLSAHISSMSWKRGKKRMSIKGDLKRFDPNKDEADSWMIKLTTPADAGQAVITSLLASSQAVILLLDKPLTLCSGKISGKFKCYQMPSNLDTIGGMQLHLGDLYVSAGKKLFRLKIKGLSPFRNVLHGHLVMNLPDTPSETIIDVRNGTRMIFYSMESIGRIGRILKSHKQIKHMDPLNISCNHFTFTVDPIDHVMYVLTDDRKLSLITDIHTEIPPTRSTVMEVPKFFDWPITKLLFSVNTIYLIWPGKNGVMFLDVEKKCYRSRRLSNKLISRPPRGITVITH